MSNILFIIIIIIFTIVLIPFHYVFGKFLQGVPIPTVTVSSKVKLLRDGCGVVYMPLSNIQLGEIQGLQFTHQITKNIT